MRATIWRVYMKYTRNQPTPKPQKWRHEIAIFPPFLGATSVITERSLNSAGRAVFNCVVKPKQYLQAITTDRNSAMSRSELKAITCIRVQSRENTRVQVATGSGFASSES